MASPNCKRLKMDQEASSSTIEKETLQSNDQIDFNPSTSDFAKIAKENCFVDKTLLIRDIVNYKVEMILITAPRRFGKSTNMDMVKKFFEIQVDDNGVVINKGDSSNYKIFKDIKLLIFQDKNFFDEHFATYPVIHTSFKPVSGESFDEVLKGFRTVLKRTYLQHRYLMKSQIWSRDGFNIDTFKKYIDSEKSKTLDVEEIKEGIACLSMCLHEHFGNKKVFVLIDEYDAPINNTMFEEKINIGQVNKLLGTIFSNTLKENQYVERALLTGISHFANVGLSGVNNVEKCMFLGNHPFVKWYGLIESEVDELLSKFKIGVDVISKVKCFYNGYNSRKGGKLFSMWSILHYLKKKELKSYWEQSGIMTDLEKALNVPVIRYCIEKICKGRSVVIDMIERSEIEHITELRNISLQGADSETKVLEKPDVYLSFIFQQGYLTYDVTYENVDNPELCALKAPNAEIVSEFRKKLQKYYTPSVNSCLEKCSVIFDKISPKPEDDCFRDFITEFNRVLSALEPRFVKKNEDTYHSLMFSVLCKSKFLFGTEFTFTGGRIDLVLFKENLGIVIEMKYKKSSRDALQQIVAQYLNVFVEDRFQSVTDKIYIGMNVNENNKVEMGVLVNSANLDDARIFT